MCHSQCQCEPTVMEEPPTDDPLMMQTREIRKDYSFARPQPRLPNPARPMECGCCDGYRCRTHAITHRIATWFGKR